MYIIDCIVEILNSEFTINIISTIIGCFSSYLIVILDNKKRTKKRISMGSSIMILSLEKDLEALRSYNIFTHVPLCPNLNDWSEYRFDLYEIYPEINKKYIEYIDSYIYAEKTKIEKDKPIIIYYDYGSTIKLCEDLLEEFSQLNK